MSDVSKDTAPAVDAGAAGAAKISEQSAPTQSQAAVVVPSTTTSTRQPPAPLSQDITAQRPLPSVQSGPADASASADNGGLASLQARLERLEGEAASARFAAELHKAGASAGVKDPDYVEYLAGKERVAKGDKFELGAFLEGLRGSKPELFRGAAPAAPASSAPAAVPSQGGGGQAAIEAQLADAKKGGKTQDVLRLQTELARLRQSQA